MATPSNPLFFDSPIAASGDKNPITGDSEATDIVSIKRGFPSAFSSPRSNNGKSVSRMDMNGILNSISTLNYYFQYMGRNPWVATDSHGATVSYKLGSKVWYVDSDDTNTGEYISTMDGNTYTPGGTDKNPGGTALAWIKINDLNGIVTVPYEYDDQWIHDKFDEIDQQIYNINIKLDELSGRGGTYVDLEYLEFTTPLTSQFLFNSGVLSGLFPQYSAVDTTSGSTGYIESHEADRLYVCGVRCSLDIPIYSSIKSTAFPYSENYPDASFFSWRPDSDSQVYIAPSLSIRRSGNNVVAGKLMVSVDTNYTRTLSWDNVENEDGTIFNLSSSSSKIVEMACGWGVNCFSILSGDSQSGWSYQNKSYSIWSTRSDYPQTGSVPFKKRSFGAVSSSDYVKIKIGNLYEPGSSSGKIESATASKKYEAIKIHTIFFGYIEKTKGTTSSPGSVTSSQIQELCYWKPKWRTGDSPTWAWEGFLGSEFGTHQSVGITCVGTGYSSQIFKTPVLS